MAGEYIETDWLGLQGLADLYARLWEATDGREFVRLAAEIRQTEGRFGLSPTDRARLRWEVARGDEAEERTASRRRGKSLAAASTKDPRAVLQIVP